MSVISLVVPMYNEASTVEKFLLRSEKCIKRLGIDYEIICVNDGSTDKTLVKLHEMVATNPNLKVIDLSRNFGKEAALTAGLDQSIGDAVIPIDCDLQDPPEVIEQLYEKWREGNKIVLAKRMDRSSDTIGKRLTANLFYKLHNSLTRTKIPENVGDFRLMDRAVVEKIKSLPERQRFMKGLFTWVGYPSTTIEYVRESRYGGKTKWNYWRLWNFSIDAITSFSTVPLRIWTYIGLFVSSLSFIYVGFVVIRTIVYGIETPGFASLMVAILFLGGLQLICLGVLGEYVGRIYTEVKQRPIYLIKDIYTNNENR